MDGCLFNLTADPSETENLYGSLGLAKEQASMIARLNEAGETLAAPWAIVPELLGLPPANISAKLCAAAQRLNNVAPIDL